MTIDDDQLFLRVFRLMQVNFSLFLFRQTGKIALKICGDSWPWKFALAQMSKTENAI